MEKGREERRGRGREEWVKGEEGGQTTEDQGYNSSPQMPAEPELGPISAKASRGSGLLHSLSRLELAAKPSGTNIVAAQLKVLMEEGTCFQCPPQSLSISNEHFLLSVQYHHFPPWASHQLRYL